MEVFTNTDEYKEHVWKSKFFNNSKRFLPVMDMIFHFSLFLHHQNQSNVVVYQYFINAIRFSETCIEISKEVIVNNTETMAYFCTPRKRHPCL